MEFGRRQTIMANSRELRDPFTLYYSSKVIHDEEFILLYDVFSSKNLNLPYEDYQRFSFDHMEPDECKAEFRFWKNDIHYLPMLYKYHQIWFVLKEPLVKKITVYSTLVRNSTN